MATSSRATHSSVIWLPFVPLSALGHGWSSAAASACRAVSLRTADAHGLYSQLGFLPADETVMQRPRPSDS